jgi:hypothetical protein
MAFVKGQSGNPGGRPKSVDGHNLRDLARAHTKEALDTLIGIMGSTTAPEAARISAANSILDRGYGRPAQTLGDADGNPIEWMDFIAAARSRALRDDGERETVQ